MDEIKKTPFDNIYSLFLNSIQDYSIRNLFISDLNIANDMVKYFLIRAIPKFHNCIKDLNQADIECEHFPFILEIDEQVILSDLMVLSWMDRVVNDITQMNLSLNDNDFRHFSEERNLREKSDYAERIREKVNQEIVNYGFRHTPFSRWAVGDYGF